MLYKSTKTFVKLIIIFAITECSSIFRSESCLNTAIYPFQDQVSSALKQRNIQEENVQHTSQTSIINNAGDNKNEEKSISNGTLV